MHYRVTLPRDPTWSVSSLMFLTDLVKIILSHPNLKQNAFEFLIAYFNKKLIKLLLRHEIFMVAYIEARISTMRFAALPSPYG